MKLVSYNVNGIRSALNKGLLDWLKESQFDVVCLQEVKASYDQINPLYFTELGYKIFWNSAVKRGYSGVAVLTKVEPQYVEFGIGDTESDHEGRVIKVDFRDFSLINAYVPSGSSGDIRQAFKMKWLSTFQRYIERIKVTSPHLIICGDINICHKPIDIHNPISNKNSSGFLPEEREWVTRFLERGFVDAFRHCCQDPHRYSWWTYRANARVKNLGWRIDYHLVSSSMQNRIKRADIFEQIIHSDHCPVYLEIE